MAALRASFARSRTQCFEFPSGQCNYRDLGSGQKTPVCGCKRFWVNRARFSNSGDCDEERAWCFCGHHACYHDAAPKRLHAPLMTADVLAGTETVAESQGFSPSCVVSTIQAAVGPHTDRSSTPPEIRPDIVGLGLNLVGPQLGIWDTLNAYARRQADSGSASGSTLPSTAVPSIAETQSLTSHRAFAQQSLNQPRQMGPPLLVPSEPAERQQETMSATEVNTPSMAGTPDLYNQRMLASNSPQPDLTRSNRPHAGLESLERSGRLVPDPIYRQSPQAESSKAASARRSGADPQPNYNLKDTVRAGPLGQGLSPIELQNLVRSCAQRLEILENQSSSHIFTEEIEEKFELLDARILDLETWRTDSEDQLGIQEAARTSTKRRLLPTELTESFSSNASLNSKASARSSSSALSATAAVYAEFSGRLEDIEQRLDVVEERLPSYNHPWQVEVILLPWGRDLRGIWMAPRDDMPPNHAREDWNGLDASAKSCFGESDAQDGWTTDSIRAWADTADGWLCARACGPTGDIYKRLQSRGLVQTISMTSPDAYNFLQACSKAFTNFLAADGENILDSTAHSQFEAMNERIVPLRKVRKSARLRFLQRNEMVTPALWDATFLESSIFMKIRGANRRLYMTTPHAYTQPVEGGWTWQSIQGLCPAQPSNEKSMRDSILGSEARDTCWAYRPHLDQPISFNQSFTSRSSHQSLWSIRSQVSNEHHSAERQKDDVVEPVSPVSDMRTTRDIRRSTVSLPASAEEGPSSSIPSHKRHVASFERPVLATKRRRTSAFSEMEVHGNIPTPRLSREPPSPFTAENTGEHRSQGATTGQQRRGGTPFAYATPHSNTIATIIVAGGDGDTEADTDNAANSERGRDEEWEGVVDEALLTSSGVDTGALGQDASASDSDVYDQDLDEGLTIYGTDVE